MEFFKDNKEIDIWYSDAPNNGIFQNQLDFMNG